jgi:hypothetical protein
MHSGLLPARRRLRLLLGSSRGASPYNCRRISGPHGAAVPPVDPLSLGVLDGIVMRSLQTGRIQHWTTRDAKAADMAAPLCEKIVVNDPSAMRESALLVLGVALLAVPDVLPAREEGALLRLVPRWYSDVGAISIYFASRSLLPAKPAFLSTGSRKHSGSDDCPNAFRAACHEPPTWLTSEIADIADISRSKCGPRNRPYVHVLLNDFNCSSGTAAFERKGGKSGVAGRGQSS